MRGFVGWLLLLPLIFAFWLTMTIANACARRESGAWRLLGVLASLVIGGICIQVGYWFAIEGFTEWEAGGYQVVKYPVLGWIDMIGGGIMAILGTWTALRVTRKAIELRELEEKLEKEEKQQQEKWAKEEAMKILEQGEIDDYERLDLILRILSDMHEFSLSYKLEDLKRKLTKSQRG